MLEKILIVDDDKQLLESVGLLLRDEGYYVDTFDSPKEALINCAKEEYDLIILDYFMPDINGAAFIDLISAYKSVSNILVFSGEATEDIELQILKKDVLDFISKPVKPEILLQRVRRSLDATKRSTTVELIESLKENVKVDTKFRRAYKDGELISLSDLEFRLLTLFLTHKGKNLSREYIYEMIWETKNKYLDDFRVIDVHVLNLRRKMSIDSIISIRGVGYVWNED